MRILSGFTLFFYTLVFLLVGGLFVVVSLNVLPQEAITETIDAIYTMPNIRLILGLTGVLLIFISVLVVQLAVGRFQRERTIAFDNPDGQVTISLTAIEDFIRRSMKQIPEVKELKPHVRANKKGISVVNRVVLYSDISIPETTEKIQNVVKTRIIEMLGIEEPLAIRVHVVKIVHKEEPAKEPKKDEKGSSFRGNIQY